MRNNQPTEYMETDSQNKPKAKRGRPKSWQRELNDSLGNLKPDGCTRTQVNHAHGMILVSMFSHATEQDQRDLCGHTESEIMAGTAKQLRWHSAANEIGRYVEAIGDTDEVRAAVLSVILDARRNGMNWGAIAAHFRKQRLGQRKGNAISMMTHLCRAFDEYMAKFPATTHEMQVAAIRNLMDTVESVDE